MTWKAGDFAVASEDIDTEAGLILSGVATKVAGVSAAGLFLHLEGHSTGLRASRFSRAPDKAPDDQEPFLRQVTPRFWFAASFENSRTPCICMDNPNGGDPIIIAQVEPNSFWPMYVNAMCDAATRCFRMADELDSHIRKIGDRK